MKIELDEREDELPPLDNDIDASPAMQTNIEDFWVPPIATFLEQSACGLVCPAT